MHTDVQLVAADPLVEVLDGQVRRRVVAKHRAPKVGRRNPGEPRRPERQPRDVVEEVAVCEATPVEYGFEARAVVGDQDVAVDQIEMEHVM